MLSLCDLGFSLNNSQAELKFSYHEDLIKKVNIILNEKQRNSSRIAKSKQQNLLSLMQDDLLKEDLLTRFLSNKIQYYNENLDKMLIMELRSTQESSIKIIKVPAYDQDSFKIGFNDCQKDKLSKEKIGPLCPWHWLISERENIFPFSRALAKCNCEQCQIQIFENSTNETKTQAACNPLITLTPALIRESIINGTENWRFVLEEVPTSCFCSISSK